MQLQAVHHGHIYGYPHIRYTHPNIISLHASKHNIRVTWASQFQNECPRETLIYWVTGLNRINSRNSRNFAQYLVSRSVGARPTRVITAISSLVILVPNPQPDMSGFLPSYRYRRVKLQPTS